MPEDTSPRIDKEKRRLVQQVVGSTSYYAKASDLITLVALSSVTSKQARGRDSWLTEGLGEIRVQEPPLHQDKSEPWLPQRKVV